MDVVSIRKDFPVLDQKINGHPLIYLDNAATTQVPCQVMNEIQEHYASDHGNVHRGIHTLSSRSTDALEAARRKTAEFLGAGTPDNTVFTQGTTASINMIARGLEREVRPGDEILVTELEHHSNYLPWQQLCKRTGATFVVAPQKDGELDREAFRSLLNSKTKIAAFNHVSNLTGTVNDIAEMVEEARKVGALTVVDGAQAVRHEMADVSKIGCSFYCFSGHKMLAGTGIGVLYGEKEALERLEPVWFGGGMVEEVEETDAVFSDLPYRLEAGTGSFVQAIALGAAIDYILKIGREEICDRERELLRFAEQQIAAIPEAEIIGHPKNRSGCLSIRVSGIHPYDLASVLDHFGVAVRSGTHCAKPALRSLGVSETLRISPAFYNTEEELIRFAEYLKEAIKILNRWGQYQ